MSIDPERISLVANDLFADALGEAFVPKCDPQARQHTLGRLMVASILKGTTEDGVIYEYTPSWAPKTEVMTFRNAPKLGMLVNGLELKNESSQRYLNVAQFITKDEGMVIRINQNYQDDEDRSFDRVEELGDKLLVVRQALVRAAITAFNYPAS